MNPKLVFLDIDGTLTIPGSNEPPESAQAAVRKAQKNGHKVVLCTGRSYAMLAPLLRYGFDGFVASSGGYIIAGKDSVVYDAPMTKEEADRVRRILSDAGIFCTAEGKYASYTDEGFKEYLRAHDTEGSNSEFLRWREQIEKDLHILSMSEYDGSPLYKFVLMCPAKEGLEKAKYALEDTCQFQMQEMDERGIINGELIPRSFDKGQAVRRLSASMGIPLEDTIAFGDSMNDLEMMDAVAWSVCMDNGASVLKKRADMVCPAVTEEGLYKGFAACGLLEEET